MFFRRRRPTQRKRFSSFLALLILTSNNNNIIIGTATAFYHSHTSTTSRPLCRRRRRSAGTNNRTPLLLLRLNTNEPFGQEANLTVQSPSIVISPPSQPPPSCTTVITNEGGSSTAITRTHKNADNMLPSENDDHNNEPHLPLAEVNVVYNARSTLIYDAAQERYTSRRVPVSSSSSSSSISKQRTKRGLRTKIISWLTVAFVPAAVTKNYYRFMTWRLWHRFINANLNVFGTQCLLLSLGVGGSANQKQISHVQLGALSAALQWVVKDALGKFVRMAWASKMGSHMDGDAKRWMMRSAFSFGLGNFLEIATYMFPHWFLFLAAISNCCKQVSMLTGSSTRSAIFHTFRDGTMAENIGDISAKGEAQVAIVDLAGLATGVLLSKAVVGTSLSAILSIYAILQSLELACVYRQIRSVEFRVLNFERLMTIVTAFFCQRDGDGASIPTPAEMARSEKMMRPPDRLFRRQVAFGSLSRCRLSPNELKQLLVLFQNERFLLVVGANVKRSERRFFFVPVIAARRRRQHKQQQLLLQENCHIVLHTDATNADIVKSTLALHVLRRRLAGSSLFVNQNKNHNNNVTTTATLRTADCYDLIDASLQEANEVYGAFSRATSKRGWDSPSKSMFGRVRMRAEWPRDNPMTSVRAVHPNHRHPPAALTL